MIVGMIEPLTACRWNDPYAQAPVDLSRVLWIATANSLPAVGAALRDRFRIVQFPVPETGHLVPLANGLMAKAVRDRGMDPAWALPLDAMELDALSGAWEGGSIRGLTRLVEAVLDARDVPDVRH